MQIGVLTTDYGKHSPEKLAVATAGQIIDIGASASGQQAMSARKLENEIIDILEQHHIGVGEAEVRKLEEDPSHLVSHLDPGPHIPDTYDKIIAATMKSTHREWFEKPEVQEHIRQVLASWTATNMHMHRDWHANGYTGHGTNLKPIADHDPESPHVKQWKYRTTKGGHGSGVPAGLMPNE